MYHKNLTVERWRGFSPGVQILHLGSEFHRLEQSLTRGDALEAERAWLRALELADLSVETARPGAHRREFCRIREVLIGVLRQEQPESSVRELRRTLVGDL